MLSSSISCISCYLKASCFRPKPLQKHQQPEHEIKKRSPRTLQFWNLQTLPKPPRNPPQTPPKPLKMEPKSNPGRIQAPKKNAKKWPKRGQDPPNPSQNLPQTLPKPSPNLPKIAQEHLLGSIWQPRGTQEHPRGAQEAPKRRPRAPKSRPRASKSRPRAALERPRAAQAVPRVPM